MPTISLEFAGWAPIERIVWALCKAYGYGWMGEAQGYDVAVYNGWDRVTRRWDRAGYPSQWAAAAAFAKARLEDVTERNPLRELYIDMIHTATSPGTVEFE